MRITLKSATKEFVDQEIEVGDDLLIRDLLDVVQKRFLLNGEYNLTTLGPGSRALPSHLSLAGAGLRTGMIVQMISQGRRIEPPPPAPPMPSRPEIPLPGREPPVSVPPSQPPVIPQQPPAPVMPQTIAEPQHPAPPPAAPSPAQPEVGRTMIDMPIPTAPPPKPALSETLQEIPVPPLPPKPAEVVNIWMEPAPTDSQAGVPQSDVADVADIGRSNTLVEVPLPKPDPRREATKPLADVPPPGEMYNSKPEMAYPAPGTPIPTVADPLASIPPSPAPIPQTSVRDSTPPQLEGFGPTVHSALLAEDGQVFRLSQPVTVIGRPGNVEHGKVDIDLSVLDPQKSTSRPHARIDLRKGQYYVRDLMSSNGVMVNKVRITPAVDCPLQDGDKLQLGNVKLTFRVVQPAR